MARILIVCENDSETERLKIVFAEAGLTSESSKSMPAACELAQSDRFQVIFSAPLLSDGPWTRLIDVAAQGDLDFEIVLLARTFNLGQWGEALQLGAFDVLDVVCDLPTVAQAAKRACGTSYLRRFRAHAKPVA